MSKLIRHIEELRNRLTEIANNEEALVMALGDALDRVDRKLLDDVRSVTAEHEARRGAVLDELRSLASRIGALPAPREPRAALEDGGTGVPTYVTSHAERQDWGRGDWRQAAKNIEDDLDFELSFDADGRVPSH